MRSLHIAGKPAWRQREIAPPQTRGMGRGPHSRARRADAARRPCRLSRKES